MKRSTSYILASVSLALAFATPALAGDKGMFRMNSGRASSLRVQSAPKMFSAPKTFSSAKLLTAPQLSGGGSSNSNLRPLTKMKAIEKFNTGAIGSPKSSVFNPSKITGAGSPLAPIKVFNPSQIVTKGGSGKPAPLPAKPLPFPGSVLNGGRTIDPLKPSGPIKLGNWTSGKWAQKLQPKTDKIIDPLKGKFPGGNLPFDPKVIDPIGGGVKPKFPGGLPFDPEIVNPFPGGGKPPFDPEINPLPPGGLPPLDPTPPGNPQPPMDPTPQPPMDPTPEPPTDPMPQPPTDHPPHDCPPWGGVFPLPIPYPVGGYGGYGTTVVQPVYTTTTQYVEQAAAPQAAPAAIDLELVEVRQLDRGDASQQLGPAYRLTIRNRTGLAVSQPFNVALGGALGRELTEDSAISVIRVNRLEAGQTLAVDMRLPLKAFNLGVNADGRAVTFNWLIGVVDSHQEVEQTDRDNDYQQLDRNQIVMTSW